MKFKSACCLSLLLLGVLLESISSCSGLVNKTSTRRRKEGAARKLKANSGQSEIVFASQLSQAPLVIAEGGLSVQENGQLQEQIQLTISSIALIDQYTRENLQQFQMINDCNEKLINIQNELTSLNMNDWSGAESAPVKVGTQWSPPSPSFSNANMLASVREHLVTFFK